MHLNVVNLYSFLPVAEGMNILRLPVVSDAVGALAALGAPGAHAAIRRTTETS